MLQSLCFLIILKSATVDAECLNSNVGRNTFLWSVSDAQTGLRGFLFGTIHVPYTEVWNTVSDRVKEALTLCDSVLLEVDLHDNNTIYKLAKCKNLPKKQTARSYLSPQLYKKVNSLMKHFGNTRSGIRGRSSSSRSRSRSDTGLAGNWYRKRPEWLLFLLYHLSDNLPSKTTPSPILDVFLAQQALEKQKSIGAIESVEEQCRPITSLSSSDIVFAINYTVQFLEYKQSISSAMKRTIESRGQHLRRLVENYRCGNLEQKVVYSNEFNLAGINMTIEDERRADEINKALKHDILFKRNEVMAKRLDQYFTKSSEKLIFTAIGIGHFFGKLSIIRSLRKMGYIIQPIENDYHLNFERRRPRLRVKSLWNKDDSLQSTSDVASGSHHLNSRWLFTFAGLILLLMTVQSIFQSI